MPVTLLFKSRLADVAQTALSAISVVTCHSHWHTERNKTRQTPANSWHCYKHSVRTMHQKGMQLQHYLQSMQNDGHWGTDVEIIAAANLFNCSIMCLSRYGSSHSLCIQHFSPHFITSATCGTSCDHQVTYLVNSSGNHYELAQVTATLTEE